MTQEKKLVVVVVGATGNQGGSVARRFLQDSRYAVRGLTRNPSSAASQALVALGADMVAANLDDPQSLDAAFAGANIIFSVTQYWEPFFRPDCRATAQELGVTCRKYAYDVEYRQGKNIADAAAKVVDTLEDNGFLVSTLSHARKCSGGKFTDLYHFDSKADIFPDYVRENYPALAAKMSCVQTGFFMTSHAILPNSYFQKVCCPFQDVVRLLLRELTGCVTASRWLFPHALPVLAQHADPPSGRQWRHWKLCVCRSPDATGQGLHCHGLSRDLA